MHKNSLLIKSVFWTLVLSCLSSPLSAQETTIPFFHRAGRFQLGTEQNRTASVSVGDIDQDGDQDVVVANGRHWPQSNYLFFNSGGGRFNVKVPLSPIESTTYAAELGDLDGDGDLDLAIGNDMAPNRLFFNDGKGRFTERGSFGKTYAPSRNLTLSDLNDDGYPDIIEANSDALNLFYFNRFGRQKD